MPTRKTTAKPTKKAARKRKPPFVPLYGFVPTLPTRPRGGRRKQLADAVATQSIETEENDWYEE